MSAEQQSTPQSHWIPFPRQVWHDADLQWNKSTYPYDEVALPVDKVWTPELHVTNG